MFRRWAARHKSLVSTVASGFVIASLIATIAVISTGYASQRMDLNDSSVWVANGTEQVIGRANTAVLELNTVVQAAGDEIEVVQRGTEVLLFDRENNTVDIVDPATSTIEDSAPMPADSPEVHLAGDNVVIHATRTGAVWILPYTELANFDAATEPTLNFGEDSIATVSDQGVVFAFSADTRKVYRVDATSPAAVSQSQDVDVSAPGDDFEITAVGDAWVLFNQTTRELVTQERTIDLADAAPSTEDAALQRPSATDDSVLVATGPALLSVPLNGGTIRELVSGQSGNAIAPVIVDGCNFAAWTGGNAWRQCAGMEGTTLALTGLEAGSQRTTFAVNGDRVVLSDPASGNAWAVQQGGELIANWDELILAEEDQREVEEIEEDTPPEFEKDQVPPVAIDDAFGARPGRTSVLPLLLNDYDPNGDVLVITEVVPIDPNVGRIDVINNAQQAQLSLAPGASGEISFGYTISDGRGGVAQATVTITTRSPEENSPPVQLRPTKASVAQNGRVSTPVLGDWVDPDGDAFYLADAGGSLPDQVSHKPEGTVVFQEGGAAGQLRSIALTVSDGSALGSGSMSVTVRAAGDVPIIADPFVVQTYAGREATVEPLNHVRGGTGVIRLSGVPAKTGATIESSVETGTFRFTSEQIRTHYIEYVVTDGDQTATGLVRIDVAAPPDANSKPITIPKTIFVKTLSSETIRVAATDIDPAGGVLMVTGVDDLGVASGVRAEVLEQRAIRVTLTAPLDAGTLSFGYRVSNGLAESEGVVTVVELPRPARTQAPVATDDTVSVRLGDAIDIPVLANDVHPDGEDLTLNPELVSGLKQGSGLLFASGNKLRYLAPKQTGNFTAVYEVAGPDGQVAQAQVRIAVREAIEATNTAPVPQVVTARVLAGEKVSIRIPLTGIDPDGDSVQLLGQESNPEKGAVSQVGADFIEYEAGGYSAGTDTFTYTVMDGLGARSIGTVRVGISPVTTGARNPVANPDVVRVRPGGTVSVLVLANDSDPGGSPLTVTGVEPNSPDIVAVIEDDIITITPPEEPDRYGLVYTIENEFGGTSSNFITVEVDPVAPLAYPVALDTVLTLTDILDREVIDVDVLRNVFFADGDSSALRLGLLAGYRSSAVITDDKRVQVTVENSSQIIPFSVAHPDDPDIVSYAFVWVPGYDDALPQLDRRANPLTVESESELIIELGKRVITIGGQAVRLTDSATVRATHSDGSDLVVDDNTLRFTSADKYFGPASISFEVTDGTSASDPNGRKATLVLPITVTPRENQPPVFTGGVIDFEPAEEKVLDLLKLTNYPYPDDIDELAYTVIEPLPVGFSYSLSENTLTLRANADASKGASTGLTLGVRDDLSVGQPGRIQLNVVASSRPLASPAPDTAIVKRGETTVVNVLANDEATNPFPGRPLKVVDIRGLGGGSLPDGVTVVPSADRSRLTVTVSEGALPIDTSLQYQVADATSDPDRRVWGTVTLSVQDVPDAPIAPTRAVAEYVGGVVTLRITAPAFNNSPITGYRVVSTNNGGYSKDCGLQLRCDLTDLTIGAMYEFRVIATNGIGDSEPSPASTPVSADYLPAPVGGITAVATNAAPAGGAITINWNRVADPSPGTAVSGYTVRITGSNVDAAINVGPGANSLVDTTAGGALVANQQYSVTVYARNSAQASDAQWNRNPAVTVTTVGPPSAVPGLAAVVHDTSGNIRVEWAPASWNGAVSGTYSIGRVDVGDQVPSRCDGTGLNKGVSPASSGWVDTHVNDGNQYIYIVYADNGLYCTPTVSGAVESKRPPGQASGSIEVAHSGAGFHDVAITSLSVASGNALRYEYSLGDGVWRTATVGAFISVPGSLYGSTVNVQFRGCRDASASYCGASSSVYSAMPMATRADVASCAPGSPLEGIVILPLNPGASTSTVTYQVSYESLGLIWGAFRTPDPGETVPGGATGIRVKATVTIDGTTRTDPEFDEARCQTP
ncbi:Ig-like domain-containing protein [Homoserinimonas sp. A520]